MSDANITPSSMTPEFISKLNDIIEEKTKISSTVVVDAKEEDVVKEQMEQRVKDCIQRIKRIESVLKVAEEEIKPTPEQPVKRGWFWFW